MLDDEYDMRIKEAADHYHPEYDDTAWQKMEQLLDEHLPVEKERKKISFLIPSLLLISSFLLFIFLYKGENKKSDSPQNQVSKNKTEKSVVTNRPNDFEKISNYPRANDNKKVATVRKKNSIEKNIESFFAKKSQKKKSVSYSNQNIVSALSNDLAVKRNDELKGEEAITQANSDEMSQVEDPVFKKTSPENKSDLLIPGEKENKADAEKSAPQKEMIAQDNITKTEKVASKNISKKTKKTSHSFANNFGVSLSAGPDISGVDENKIGKLTLAYGVGLGYEISKNINLRTGFYLSKKIYSVGPKDYKIPAGSLGNYEYLENVDANCIVYEIPVKLDYSFGNTKSHGWFVSGGLSSYLMKKENYEYYFKTPAGQLYDKDWSVSNKNKHFFSVLSVSGGYQYFLNKQFAIIAEPYINVPLTGIGSGKVKLKSGGILFTIKAKPFLKSH